MLGDSRHNDERLSSLLRRHHAEVHLADGPVTASPYASTVGAPDDTTRQAPGAERADEASDTAIEHAPTGAAPPALALFDAADPVQVASVGRFAGRGLLGRGGMGEVWLVHDAALGRELAVKMLRGADPEPRALKKFLVEAQVTGQLEHPHIVPVHELGLADGERPYFAMKRIRGRDLEGLLAEEVARHGPGARPTGVPAPPRALVPWLEIFLKVCDAVAFAHSKRVLHRDLKPANVMVGDYGEVLVCDWGLARQLDQAPPADPVPQRGASSDDATVGATVDGDIVGTPGYMSPEQARGEIATMDERSDVWALGAILYRILALEPPSRESSPWARIAEAAEGRYVSPRERAPGLGIPWELDAVVQKAMAVAPADRYADVPALRADVVAFLEGRRLGAARYSALERLRRWVRAHRSAAWAAAALLVGGAAVTGTQAVLRGRELARQEAEFATRYDTARRELAPLEARRAAVTAPDGPSLVHPNGEPVTLAIAAWFEAHASMLDALDGLARLADQAPSATARRSPEELARIGELRRSLALAAAERATTLGDWMLARSWVGRASSAGLDRAEQARRLDAIESARTTRIQRSLDLAREVLARAATVEREAFEIEVTELVRAASPDLVRMLLDPAHLDAAARGTADLAIEALGRIGDTRTVGADGKDAVVALTERLAATSPSDDLPRALALARALGYLRDARAFVPLQRARHRAGSGSPFWVRTEAVIARIPMPAEYGADTPQLSPDQLDDQARALLIKGDLDSALRACDAGIDALHAIARPSPADRTTLASLHNLRGQVHDQRGGEAEARGDAPAAAQLLATARAEYDAALRAQGDFLSALCNRAISWWRSGLPERGLADLDRAVSVAPDRANVWSLRGQVRAAVGQRAGAHADFSKAIVLDPADDQPWLLRGEMAMDQKQFDAALADFDRGVALSPTSAVALHMRGDCLVAKGEIDRGLLDLSRALELDPRRTKTWTRRGRTFLERGELERARADLEQAVALDPTDAPARVWLGETLGRAGDLVRATTELDRAIELDLKSADAHRVRSWLRLRSGNAAGAEADASVALELAPMDAAGWVARARARRELGRLDLALADADQALAVDPRSSGAHRERGLVFVARGAWAETRAAFDRALELDPRDLEALVARGNARGILADHAGAAADYTRALELGHPQRARVLTQRATAKGNQGDVIGALADLDLAIDQDPTWGKAYVTRGRLRHHLRDLDGAERDLGRALELDPNAGDAWFELGHLRETRGDLEGAIERYERASTIAPTVATYFRTGRCHQQAGRLEPAIAAYGHALALAPGLTPALVNRAQARAALGDVAGAVVDLDRAVEVEPGDEAARMVRAQLRIQTNQIEPALVDLRAVVSKDDRAWRAWAMIALSEEQLQRWAPALEAIAKAIAGAPETERGKLEGYRKRIEGRAGR